MGNRGISTTHVLVQLLLWLALLCPLPAVAQADGFQLYRLPVQATADQVLAGEHDQALVAQPGRILYEPHSGGRWWQLRATRDFPADLQPKLVFETPVLYRVQVWRPGEQLPTRHALYGPDADSRYSTRALVADLPAGLQQGQALWMRVDAPGSSPSVLSIQPLDAVHKADLVHVAWRSSILATIAALALLAAAFWIGSGENGHGYFAAMLMVTLVYLGCMGGELRYLGWLGDEFFGSPQLQRSLACLGVASCNMFQRLYLDLPRRMPRANGVLLGLTICMLLLCIASALSDSRWIGRFGNVGLIASALMILVTSVRLACRGSGPGRVVVISWLPLVVFVTLRALEMMELWTAQTAFTTHALDASFALAALGLTLGLTLKLVELRRDRDQASALASIDALTAAMSRRAIEEAVANAAEKASRQGSDHAPVSVAFVDLDFFKQINDQHGHDVGDQFLRQLVARLRGAMRSQDRLGRYGGDEFLLLMPATTAAQATQVAQRLCDAACSRPIEIGGQAIPVSLSIGVSQFHSGDSVSQLLRRADSALYASKAAGRGCVSCSDPAPSPSSPPFPSPSLESA